MGVRLREGFRNKEPGLSVSDDLQLSLPELAVELRTPASFLVIVIYIGNSQGSHKDNANR
jgi:hypothetical protein